MRRVRHRFAVVDDLDGESGEDFGSRRLGDRGRHGSDDETGGKRFRWTGDACGNEEEEEKQNFQVPKKFNQYHVIGTAISGGPVD